MRLHIANTMVEGKRYTLIVLPQKHAEALVRGEAIAFDWKQDTAVGPGRLVLAACEDTDKPRAEMEPFMNAVMNSLREREDELAEMS